MERMTPQQDRQRFHHSAPVPLSSYSPAFPTTASTQPSSQMSVSDPFHNSRDPFLSNGHVRPGNTGSTSRAWAPTTGQQPNHHQLRHHQQHQQHQPPPARQHHSPPPHTSGQGQPLPPPLGMPPPHPYDSTRRSSLGGIGSPPQYSRGPLEPPPSLPQFPARNMPPPSPPQMSSSSHLRSAPPGPPIASPFSGARDLASNRSGMSISSILGGSEERKHAGSPPNIAAGHPLSTTHSVMPPSPGRVRSSSLREGASRGYRDLSPQRTALYREPSRASAEPRRENIFGSPPFRSESTHSFRAFQPSLQEHPHAMHAQGAPARPNSQPVDSAGPQPVDERASRDTLHESRYGVFRQYADQPAPSHMEGYLRQERAPISNGVGPHPQERSMFTPPQAERESRGPAPLRFPSNGFGPPLRDEQAPLFRPAMSQPTSHPASDPHREANDGRAHEMRRQLSRPSPPLSDMIPFERSRNGNPDRRITLEEHQRMERISSGNRKESEGSVHRAILNISPDLSRKGRSSPLPQAVQGAQPRHIGPGGNNPGIKTEFGRMFSGLGSGVGGTPPIGQSANGFSTPSRLSPARHLEGELGRHSEIDVEEIKPTSKAGTRGKRNGRRSREDFEPAVSDGRNTPDLQRGNKRSKTNHPPPPPSHHHHHHLHGHHHHHHHHDAAELAIGGFNMLRFPSNPPSNSVQTTPAPHHHHHHHHHAHAAHHHHHTPRLNVPAAKKPVTTVDNTKVLELCASKPRKHLGSQLYTTEVSLPPAADTPLDAKVKFSSKMKSIPLFEGRENCTFTVRVPRYFLANPEVGSHEISSFGEICKRRQLWGTEIYSDDSDVVVAAVHSGWLKGNFGDFNEDIRDVLGNSQDPPNGENDDDVDSHRLETRPKNPVSIPEGHDAHITVLILPPLEHYSGTNQNHIWSREWKKNHDGMSFMIHSVAFVDEGPASRFTERGGAARKKRIAMEEAERREAAAGLLMFATGGQNGGVVQVGA